MSFKITSISAFIAMGDDQEEGIIAMQVDDKWFPMVMADEARLNSLRPFAEQVAKAQKKQISLVRFSVREDLETLDGT